MKLSAPERFHLGTLEELRREARHRGLDLPVSDDVAVLKEPVRIGDRSAPNRLCVHPMEGCDAGSGGVPGELTLRRYRRYAEGGFGLIWVEATAVDGAGRSNPRQLWLNRRNVKAFAELVRDVRQAARHRCGHEIVLVLQLAHAGRYSSPEGVADPVIAHHHPHLDRRLGLPADYPVVSDDDLDRLQELYVAAGILAAEAGFDGIDVKACHGDLSAELLAAVTRPGRYGGSLENRSRFLRETTAKLRVALRGTLLASRIAACKAEEHPSEPGGSRQESLKMDSSEPEALARMARDAGAQLLSISDGDPSGSAPGTTEHPLVRFVRRLEMTRAIQQAVPEIPVVVSGFSWFRHLLPNVAAGVVGAGGGAVIGIGRAALAYPTLAGDLVRTDHLDPDKCCIGCSACLQLIKDGGTAGCAIMDAEIYGAAYRHRRHFALDNLQEEAQRCLGCEPAPCQAGCPARIDVPAFLKAFAEDDIGTAYSILRRSNVLPGMCAHLCPVGSLCEGRCVTNTLEGKPIPIHDIQYVVSWMARQRGLTGVRVPEMTSGKKVAVVGGGPAGLACATTLLERGHRVVLIERASRLGGTPERVIRSSRYTGSQEEIESLLQPALAEARLVLRFGCELGHETTMEAVRREYDAVFLAAGVWGERSLGPAEGVVAGVTFLQRVRSKEIREVPPRVILLAGGDSAMDCAEVARELGARELTIVFAGPLSDMHWHMPDSWFRTAGVHFMTLTRPIEYRVGTDGKVTGLTVRMNLGSAPSSPLSPGEFIEADMIIEAMGLALAPSLRAALQGCQFDDHGLVRTPGPSSMSCGLPGVYAGGGMINGGASVVQCVAEGMRAGREIDAFLRTENGVKAL